MGWRARAEAATTIPQEIDVARIDRYIEAEMAADGVPGVALAIVQEGEIVHLRGYGVAAPGIPMTPQHAFVLGSMSKAFTAMAVMQLIEAGKVELEAPIQRYLPWFRVADADASATITVRQLLNHTSGLPVGAGRDQSNSTLEAHVRGLSEVALVHTPGEFHEYSSANYLVLGLLVETLSGQPFGEYVETHIFTPLDMKQGYTVQAEAERDGTMASGYQYWLSYPVATTLDHEHDRLPTAALIASAEDMAHFMIAQLGEGKYAGQNVLSPASVAEMHRPTAPSNGFSYAMGWRVSEAEGVDFIFHGGIVPNFRGQMVMLPEQETGVVVLTNISSVMGSPTSHRMAETVASLLSDTSPPHNNMPLLIFHRLIAFGLLMVTFNQLKDIVTVRRWAAKLPAPPLATPTLLRRIVLPLVLEIAIPLLLLVGLPLWLGFPWSEMVRQMPDMAYWLLLSAALGLFIALLKGRLVLSIFTPGKTP